MKQNLILGNFDGLHLGHQHLIQSALDKYHQQVLLMTFEPHPRQVLQPQNDFQRIWGPWDIKYFVFKKYANQVRTLEFKFDRQTADLDPLTFLEKGIDPLGLNSLTIGHDFHFGKERQGTPELLKSWCEKKGIEIQIISPFIVNNERVASRGIKELLQNGNLKDAEARLGHNVTLGGPIVKGKGVGGSQLGFPTANLKLDINPALKRGVYSGFVEIVNSKKIYPAAINLGTQPTVSSSQKFRVEAHLLDFPGTQLYGQEINIEFKKYIRNEIKFSSLEELKNQIHIDLRQVLKVHSDVS